jgi:phosphoserine phosphatase
MNFRFVAYSSDGAMPVEMVDEVSRLLQSVRTVEQGQRISWMDLPAPSLETKRLTVQVCHSHRIDAAWLPEGLSFKNFSLLALDMDSTLITVECIDEMADYCGKKADVSAITEAAMRGEISDYDTSLRQRVALLKGLSSKAMDAVYSDRVRLSRGAKQLVESAQSFGLKTLLVSGGFNYFTERIARQLKLDFVHSNELEINEGLLTGQVLGSIVNAQAKAAALKQRCQELGVPSSRAIAIGDGANDMKMMAIAGFSVAYHAKPVLHSKTSAAIHFGGLETVEQWLNF